ncbi:MAG: hypothetical protein JWP12_2061 [Bacteroidetes bacterium]|nr:hypothetical protein [Bacteroidota bacterium]
MPDSLVYAAIIRHLTGEETPEEKTDFSKWLSESDTNQQLFNKIKKVWEQQPTDQPRSFWGKFTRKKIQNFILNQAIGNFIGFVIALSVTRMFSHYVTERRNIHNLFGLAGRKKIVVNDTPEWLQWILSAVVGFIVLEFVNHLIQTKQHMLAWNYIKNRLRKQNV